jgi:DNA polymerase (family 10)
MQNAAIADALQELGDLYELDGAVIHRVRAYRTAARAVRETSVSVAELARKGRATELPGVGTTIQAKILALLDTGTIPAAERLRERFPPGLIALTRLPGLGTKRARLLYEELGIDSLQALRDAAATGRLRTVRGLGPKLEARLLEALDAGAGLPAAGAEVGPQVLLLDRALELAESLIAALAEGDPPDADVQLAGAARRGADVARSIELVATTSAPDALAERLASLEQLASVVGAGDAGTRAAATIGVDTSGAARAGGATLELRARTYAGVDVNVHVGSPAARGTLLQRFTGSDAHNAALGKHALSVGLRVCERGIAGADDGPPQPCATEQELYARLGLEFIAPELREDRGEIEAAAAHRLPDLLDLREIRGDLHCHTVASDGRASVEEMALAARARGYEYLAITDHSASHGFGIAVSPAQLREQIQRVRELDERIEGIRVLVGSEVNVLPDGSLDYDDELLAELDWVLASVHTAFGVSEQAMTERVIRAVEHPLVDALGHPTGRLIGRREPYALDIAAVIGAAAASGTMLEINANPRRRDLSDAHARAAAAAGVLLVIDSDAHRPETLDFMRFGVASARRAWLGPAQVANSRPWPELRALSKRGRPRAAV